jgi:DNA polymerase-3 subunit delta'
MSFDAIRDQEVALRFLRNLTARNRIPNGLLFWGPGGVGKHTTAIELAKAINCEQQNGDACDECLPCRKVAHGNYPDVKIITPSDKSRLIKKADVDEINEFAALRPIESTHRIFIIEDADRMNVVAQNHFLKTLEEPPGRCLFILLSEFPRVLLPTIRSRCQSVRFRALSPDTVYDLLMRDRELSEDVARAVADLAQGRMTRAFDLADSDKREIVLDLTRRLEGDEDPILLAEEFAGFLSDQRKSIEAEVNASLKLDDADERTQADLERIKEEQLALLNALVRRDILEYLYLLESWYRDQLIVGATGSTERVWNQDETERLEGTAPTQAGAKILAIENARVYLDRFVPEDRVFRDLFLRLADAH